MVEGVALLDPILEEETVTQSVIAYSVLHLGSKKKRKSQMRFKRKINPIHGKRSFTPNGNMQVNTRTKTTLLVHLGIINSPQGNTAHVPTTTCPCLFKHLKFLKEFPTKSFFCIKPIRSYVENDGMSVERIFTWSLCKKGDRGKKNSRVKQCYPRLQITFPLCF